MDSHDDGEPQKKPLSETGASPLTLVMDIKDKKHFIELKTSIERMLKMGDNNPIKRALDSLGTVHFARFAFIGEDKLAVITTYDGDFERYINAFVRDIGHIFDEILKHVKGWPEGWSVGDHRKEFLAFVNKHDLRGMPPFYSAYPNLKVQDILQMENEFKRQKKQ